MEEGSEEAARIGRPPKRYRFIGMSHVTLADLCMRLTEHSEKGWDVFSVGHDGSKWNAVVRKAL